MIKEKRNEQEKNLRELLNSYIGKGIEIPPSILEATIFNIQDSIEKALKFESQDSEQKVRAKMDPFSADTFVFGDVHGELQLFIQNLYLAGVIDRDGNYDFKNKKNVVQLGDMIDREGKNPFEAMIYLRMLKRQANTVGKDVYLIFGNHEKFSLLVSSFWNENNLIDRNHEKTVMRPTIKKMLLEDIKTGIVQLSYAHEDSKLLCFHGRISKEAILHLLSKVYEDKTYLDRIDQNPHMRSFFENLYLDVTLDQHKGRYQLKEIFQNLERVNITLRDLSDFMNQHLVRYVQEKNPDLFDYLLMENGGVYTRCKKDGKDYFINDSDDEKYQLKPIQIGGHTPTVSREDGRRAKGYGIGIIQDRASVFADADLCNGYQAFLGVDTKRGNLYAFELVRGKELQQDNYKHNGENNTFHYIKDKIDSVKGRKLLGLNINRRPFVKLEDLQAKEKAATRLLFIRHGLTDANRGKPFDKEPTLDLIGHRQAEQLTNRLSQSGLSVDAIYASTLVRAIQTAHYCAKEFKLPIVESDKLVEVGEGVTWENSMGNLPYEKRFLSDGDMEKLKVDFKKLLKEVEQIASANPGKTVLIFTHGGTIRLLRSYFNNREEGLTKENIKETPWSENTSITAMDYSEDRTGKNKFNLLLQNDHAHLDALTKSEFNRANTMKSSRFLPNF